MEENDLKKLESDLNLVKKEIAALTKERPWYQSTSTVIALFALLLSLLTTSISYVKNSHQDYLSSRVELRGLVSELAKIPHEHAEVTKLYSDDPAILSQLSGQLNTKNLVLARQAVSVVDRLENSYFGGGSVLGVEFIAIGTALVNSYVYDVAEDFFDIGMTRTSDPATAAGAIRSRASISLVKNDVEELRRLMLEASTIFEKEPYIREPQINKDVTNATTYAQWAIAESMLGNCTNSEMHIKKIGPLVSRIPESALKQQVLSQVAYVSALVGVCKKYKSSMRSTSSAAAD